MPSSVYGENGAKKKGIPPALTYYIKETSGTSPKGETIKMEGVYLHRSDWNGTAKSSSKGCLIIDGRQWRKVEKQLGYSRKIHISLSRK